MRLLEISLAILLGLYLIWPVFTAQQRPPWNKWLPYVSLVVFLLHLAMEGYRWQMLPLYILTLIILGITIFCLFGGEAGLSLGRTWKITGAILGLILLAPAVALPVLLPIPKVAPPTGPYAVGTLTQFYIDPSRDEIYSAESGEPRKFIIQVWYPVDPGEKGQSAPWMTDLDVMGPAIAEWIELPSFFLDHIRFAHTSAILEADIASDEQTFPLLIFSHGWGGFRSQNTYQVEELASHGYIVVGIQHTYGAVATIFPDGRVVEYNPQALPSGLPDDEYRAAANRLADQWAADMAFVLDQFEQLNVLDQNGRFTGRLDMDHIGIFGHSTGGGAAVEFCARDLRCNALLGLDAYMPPVSNETISNGLEQPALFLFSEAWPSESNNRSFDILYKNQAADSYAFTILGTSHYDFTDLPMLSPLAPQLGLKGPLNGPRALRIINDYSLAFFNQYLKGIKSPLLQGLSEDYLEVIIRE